MKEILWSKIIQDYRDHITNHNLRNKTAKQLQEENIGSCRTCYPAKGSPPIAFLTFFAVASRNLLAQSYTSRTVALFKQVLANLREERELTGGIIEIINKLLTTLIYKAPPTLTERGAAIFIGTLIQQTEGFERAPTSGELAALISQFTIIPKDEDLKELIGTPKFVKASNWSTHKTPELPKQPIDSGTPDSGTSPWNTINIPETTPGINAIGLNEKNPWKPPDTGKLISLPGTPNTEPQTPKGDELEDLLKDYPPPDNPLKDPFVGTSNLRFGSDSLRPLSERIPVLPTFPTWESTDDTYYYNLLRNKGPGKRKVTFERTITTPSSNLLSGGQTRYQTRYQTRRDNSPEESPDDDDDSSDNDNNNLPPNQPPPRPPPPPPPPPINMNDGNDGGNNGGQNNIMAQALTALAAALGNLQPAPAQAPRE